MKTKDEFIDSAYEKYETAKVEEEKAKRSEQIKAVTKRRKLYKYFGTAAACLVLCVGLISATGAFRMGAMSADSAAPMDAGEYNYAASQSATTTGGGMNGVMMYTDDMAADMVVESEMAYEAGDEMIYEAGDMDIVAEEDTYELAGGESMQKGTSDANQPAQDKKELKLIYRATMYLQTTDYDATVEDIKATAEKYGGYFESQESYNGDFYSDGSYRSGHFTLRIPQEHYKTFLNYAGESYFVSNVIENIEDVGKAYYDTESHLKTLKIKEERLHELLKKAEEMSDIITIESALSETEYQMQMYQSTLDDFDSLIGYSTIEIHVEKVTQYVNGVNQELTFFEKLGRNLKNGAINFGEGIERFVMWLGYNIITIAVIFIIIFLIARFDLFGKIGALFGRIFRRK